MVSKRSRLFFLLLIILPVTGQGQGIVQIENYSPDDYESSRQNWAAAQTATGTLFFGNSSGLLQFTGDNWILKHVPAGGLVRSFGTYNGEIYWGGNGDLGLVKADSLNRFYPASLRERVDSSFHNFSSVWQLLEHDEKLYAQAYEGVYIIDQDTVLVERTDAALRSVFSVS